MYAGKIKDSDEEKDDGCLDEDDVGYESSYEINPRSIQGPSVASLDKNAEDKRLRAEVIVKEVPMDQRLERGFERERQLADFKRDRDFILLSIQSALKSRNHKEAQEIVFQYRLATEIDSDFRRLAELTRSVCQERSVVDNIHFILDSTPDDDHVKRYALYERLLRLEPMNQANKDGYLLARQALALDLPQKRAARTKGSIGLWVLVVLAFIIGSTVFMSAFRLSEETAYIEELPAYEETLEGVDSSGDVNEAGIKDAMEPLLYKGPSDLETPTPDTQVAE